MLIVHLGTRRTPRPHPTGKPVEQDTAALVELAADAFRKCPKTTSIEPDGTRLTFRIRPMPFPELGDRALAMRAVG